MSGEYDYDEIVGDLVGYLDTILYSECKSKINQSYVFGSVADESFNRESDVDVFLVLDEYELPAMGDITMLCLANVEPAVQRGVGRQPGDRWELREEWGMSPEKAVDCIPESLNLSLRGVIAEPFSTAGAIRWVDIFYGTHEQLEAYASEYEEIPFPNSRN